MIKNIKNIVCLGFLMIAFSAVSQETVNGSDVSSFIIGGGQETTTATLFINEVSIVDVSPEGAAVISSGATVLLEAGLASAASGTSDFAPDIWINYSYRPISPGDQSEIFMRLSEPLPADITLQARVIETSSGGSFIDNGITTNISLTTTNTKIVNGFGAGYTEDGITNGYKIQFTYANTGTNILPPGLIIFYEIIKI